MTILIIASFLNIFAAFSGSAESAKNFLPSGSIVHSPWTGDSTRVVVDQMPAAWYSILEREPMPFTLEKTYYTLQIDSAVSHVVGQSISISDQFVLVGDIKLVAVLFDNQPFDGNEQIQQNRGLKVFLMNNSNDTLHLRPQDMSLMIIQEAMDENGVWKPVEYWQNSWCGNSYMFAVNLKPNTYVSANAPRYKGTFETKLRFKINTQRTVKGSQSIIYSNTFPGSVNPKQFAKPNDGRMINYLE